MAERPIEVAAAGRPHPHETVSGDAWQIEWEANTCRLAVVDGLGHGPEAATAAQTALTALATRRGGTLIEALHTCDVALRHTRGAAVTVVEVDVAKGALSLLGVGNVEARLVTPERERRLSPRRGIVGQVMPRLVVEEMELPAEWLLIMHSDGISERFDLSEALAGSSELSAVTQTVLHRWSRPSDDALIVALRPDGTRPGSE